MSNLFNEPLPDGWNHESGYRLNADGKHIKYKHADEELIGRIEATVVPDADDLEFIIEVYTTDGTSIEGPQSGLTKSEAISQLHDWLVAHA